MSKLPRRPPESGHIGLINGEGLKAKSGTVERLIASSHGIHLAPEDFSDLFLPALKFIDEEAHYHEISINKDRQLLIDNVAVFNLSSYYTKAEVDELQVLKSPNGTKFKIEVNDDGTLYSKKI